MCISVYVDSKYRQGQLIWIEFIKMYFKFTFHQIQPFRGCCRPRPVPTFHPLAKCTTKVWKFNSGFFELILWLNKFGNIQYLANTYTYTYKKAQIFEMVELNSGQDQNETPKTKWPKRLKNLSDTFNLTLQLNQSVLSSDSNLYNKVRELLRT